MLNILPKAIRTSRFGGQQSGDTISAAQQWCRQGVARRHLTGFARPGMHQAGDTIVEVLMAIAIVSFVLMAAYVTVHKNVNITQDTQERAQALQLGTTQIEFLRTASVGANRCFNAAGTPVGTVADNSPCVVNADGTEADPGAQPAYTITITPTGGSTSKVTIVWDSVTGGSAKSNVTLYYQP